MKREGRRNDREKQREANNGKEGREAGKRRRAKRLREGDSRTKREKGQNKQDETEKLKLDELHTIK